MIMGYFIVITALLFFQSSFNMALADNQKGIDEIRKELYSLREKLHKYREKEPFSKSLKLKNEIRKLEQQLKTEADIENKPPQETSLKKNLDDLQEISRNFPQIPFKIHLCDKQWPILKTIMDYFSRDCSEIDKTDLQSIHFLDLQNTGIKRIGIYDFLDLTQLKELYLYSNKLESIFPGLNKVQHIKTLILGNNQITDENLKKGKWSAFQNLDKIVLNNNRLTKIPKGFQELAQLQELNISYNKINSLPLGLSKLKNLKKINLKGNKLKDVPKEWKVFKNLQWIDLSENEIINIPKEWTRISTLRTVILSADRVNIGTKRDLRTLFRDVVKFI